MYQIKEDMKILKLDKAIDRFEENL